MGSRFCAMFALIAAIVSCGHTPRPAPPTPKAREAKRRTPRPPAPPEWFWEAVDFDVSPPARSAVDLPVPESSIARLDGAAKLWDDLAPEARERLRRDGVVVVGTDAPATSRWETPGSLYDRLRDERVPSVITMDALYSLVHTGLERALADVEEREIAPALSALLDKLDARLVPEPTFTAELSEAYRVARGVVAVARALATAPTAKHAGTDAKTDAKTAWTPPPELAAIVAQERGHIEGHAGPTTSPLLGVTIDYARFEVPSGAANPGMYRALAWLGAAPLALVGKTEAPGAQMSIAQARSNARAAMVLARLCDREVDPAIHALYARVLRWLGFVWGPSDDLTLGELDEIAAAAGVDLTQLAPLANVTRVDKVRARARAGRAPAAYDGAAGVGRAGISVRVFGGHAPPDSLVLSSLVGPPVGLAQERAAAAPIDRLRKGQRVLPSALDVAAWLGAREARAVLRESNADAFDGYDAALATLQKTRPSDQGSALHASVHGSLLDSLIALANADASAVIKPSTALERARLESTLAAWTLVRHTGLALARTASPSPPTGPAEPRDASAAPVFVEPLPDVVARLVGVVRQIRRGLESLGPLSRPSIAMLVELEDLLRVALMGAERHASDEAPSSEEAAALALLPARVARFEGAPADASGEQGPGPVVATIYSDPMSRRVLATATGPVEPIVMLARDPKRDDPVLVVGAHLAHHELVEGFATAPGVMHGVRPALTDASWRARLRSAPPPRAGYVASFRWAPPADAAPPSASAQPGGPDAGARPAGSR